MGQVWSKANCDGTRSYGARGGAGSVLAVAAQNPGSDGIWNTPDDVETPINLNPGHITVDANPGQDCADVGDRVRGFAGHHTGGVLFAFGDGSVRFVAEEIELSTYRAMSTMRSREIVSE